MFDDQTTVATALQGAGYETSLLGKHLNHYAATGGTYVPPGWTHWRTFASEAKYDDYDLSVDGTSIESYGHAPEDYSTDVIASIADTEIRSASTQDPLFLWIAPFAPHGPSTPAPRDVGTLDGIEPWRPPSDNEANVRDKPAYMQAMPLLTPEDQAAIDADRQDQLEPLGAVDDLVASTLQAAGGEHRPQDVLIHYATGEEEYYRLAPTADPYELTNRIAKPRFASRITTLRDKLRTMCNPLPPGMPAFEISSRCRPRQAAGRR